MKLKVIDELIRRLFEEEKGDGSSAPGEGGTAPASADEPEAPDPVVDGFLEEMGKGETPAPAPAAAPPSPTPAPAAPPAAAPAPAATPAPAPASAPASPPAAPAATPAAAPSPAPQPAAAPAAPAAPAPAAAPQPAAPAPQPAAQPAAPAPTAPAPTAPAQPTAEQIQQQITEQRNAYLQQMETAFAIPQEDHDALLATPHTVLPKYAARVHVAAVEAAISAVRSAFAPMVMQVLEQQKHVSAAEQEFYGRWPKLATPEGKAEAARLMQSYMALNKDRGITREQAINDVGLMVHAALRIPLDLPGSPAASPAAPGPGSVVPSAPPPPAQPGAAGGTVKAPQPTVWDKVDQELFTDD